MIFGSHLRTSLVNKWIKKVHWEKNKYGGINIHFVIIYMVYAVMHTDSYLNVIDNFCWNFTLYNNSGFWLVINIFYAYSNIFAHLKQIYPFFTTNGEYSKHNLKKWMSSFVILNLTIFIAFEIHYNFYVQNIKYNYTSLNTIDFQNVLRYHKMVYAYNVLYTHQDTNTISERRVGQI